MALLRMKGAKDRLMVIHYLEIDIWKLVWRRDPNFPSRVCVILWAYGQVILDKLLLLES